MPATELLPSTDPDAPKKRSPSRHSRGFLLYNLRGKETQTRFARQFGKARQEERQSVGDFGIYFMDTVRRLGETNAEYLMRIYTNALLSALRKEVIMSRANTLEAAREVAELAERAHAHISTGKTLAPVLQRHHTEDKIDTLTQTTRELRFNVRNLQKSQNDRFSPRPAKQA